MSILAQTRKEQAKNFSQVFASWCVKIKHLRPKEHKARIHNFAWLLTGIFLSKSVHLSRIADKIPGEATATSRERRLSRLLDNPVLRVRDWYNEIAKDVLADAAQSVKEIRLIVVSHRYKEIYNQSHATYGNSKRNARL